MIDYTETTNTIITNNLGFRAELYCGDFSDHLQALAADAIITDPVWPNCPRGLIPGADDPFGLFCQFCEAIPRTVRQLVICLRNDSDPRFLATVPDWLPFQQSVLCGYVLPSFLGRVLGGNEYAYVFGTPVPSSLGRRVIPSISPKAQPFDRPANGHPCSRALIHQRFLVNWFSEPGETICDPFMGSGTCGIAAMRGGRHFRGIEIEPRYYEIAVERIRRSTAQGLLNC